jgi:hypothetical protein
MILASLMVLAAFGGLYLAVASEERHLQAATKGRKR